MGNPYNFHVGIMYYSLIIHGLILNKGMDNTTPIYDGPFISRAHYHTVLSLSMNMNVHSQEKKRPNENDIIQCIIQEVDDEHYDMFDCPGGDDL